jgi:CBS domain-containing protein
MATNKHASKASKHSTKAASHETKATSHSTKSASHATKAATEKKAAYTESHKAEHRSHHATKTVGTVKDVMAPRVIAVTSVTFLPEAAQIMKQEDVGALPVVQADGMLMGILTDRDITVRAVAEGRAVDQTQVAEVFTAEDLVTVSPEMSLEEVENLMSEHRVRRLPVVETGSNRLVGIVTQADIAQKRGSKIGEVVKDISKSGGEHSQIDE